MPAKKRKHAIWLFDDALAAHVRVRAKASHSSASAFVSHLIRADMQASHTDVKPRPARLGTQDKPARSPLCRRCGHRTDAHTRGEQGACAAMACNCSRYMA